LHDRDPAPDLSALMLSLREGCGVLVYTCHASAPWSLTEAHGDSMGVLGVPATVLREVWPQLVDPRDRTRVTARLAGLAPSESATLEYRVQSADGRERWVRDSVTRTASGPDGRGALMGTLQDVSVEHLLRRQVTALEDRMWRTSRAESLSGLATAVAHDLGDLLTTVLSSLQKVEAHAELPESVRGELALAMERANRGSEFVRQIVSLAARAERGSGDVDLNQMVERLRLILERSLGPDVELVLRMDPDLPSIPCDAALFEELLLKLAGNARAAMTHGGSLTIATEQGRFASVLRLRGASLPAGAYAIVSVTDTGRGVAAELRPELPEPTSSNTGREDGDTGLGLAAVRRIVTTLGGGIDMEPTEGSGATCRVYLPVRSAAVLPELPRVAGPRRPGQSRRRVLLVEGDANLRDLVQRVLARGGFTVIAVGTAREALHIFGRVRPSFDALMTGVTLPDGAGADLVQLLRNRSEHLPVVFTGTAPAGEESLLLPDSGALYLEQPFTGAELMATMERAVPTGDDFGRAAHHGPRGG